MTDKQNFMGWAQAFLAVVFFLAVLQVVSRFSVVVLEVNPVVYSCAAFASCSLVLLYIGGRGPLAKETMRSIDTWVYGAILMLGYIAAMVLFSYVTSTEGTMLQKVSVLIGMSSSWFFLQRKPSREHLIGASVIGVGLIIVCWGIESSMRGPVYVVALFYGGLQAARILAAELHRPHAQASTKAEKDPKAKCRVVGFVMFVISLMFFFLSLLVAVAQQGQEEPFVKGLPVLADFTHPSSIFMGLFIGVVLVAPLRVLEFSSSNIIKAENFTAVTTLTFVATLFWEWVTSPLTGLSLKSISTMDMFAGVLITAGGLIIALSKMKRNTRRVSPKWENFLAYQPQEISIVEDSREIVANTLAHFEGSVTKAADALEVPRYVVQALIDDEAHVLGFREGALKMVARLYRKKVAMSDSLTGLYNRSAFLTELRAAQYETEKCILLYIDLDKFKPVNDKYGHEAGDAVLKQVAERLKDAAPKGSAITRMGGDEFCVLVLGVGKVRGTVLQKRMKDLLENPYKVEGIKEEIVIGASLGISSYPEDGDSPEELLAAADKGMYGVKHSRVDED